MSDSDPATFYLQALLQDRLTDLTDLIRSEDGQAVSQDLQNLIARVLGEIESWINRGEGPMTFEAQTTLSNMAYNSLTKNNICNHFSRKVYPFNLAYFYSTYYLKSERKIFTSQLSLFTPKCDQQCCSFEGKTASAIESTF